MMNSKIRRALLLACCAVLLVCMSVGATLAYLTSKDSVTNTFTVGKVAITLDEAPVDANGQEIDGDRVKANTYHLLPSKTYDKDPTIHIDDASEEAYLRIEVSFNKASATDKILPMADLAAAANVFKGLDASKWTIVDNTVANDVRTYVLQYNEKISGKTADIVIFTNVVVPSNLTNDQIAELAGVEMTIVAKAIQSEGFESAAEAFAAFPAE